MKALILTSAKEHGELSFSDYDYIVGTSMKYKDLSLPININVTCDKSVIDDITRDWGITHYYTSWNGGRCDYFRPDLHHLPFTWKWSSGASSVILMAYYGSEEILLSKGLTRERIDGKMYSEFELGCFHEEQKLLKVVMQKDWGYQTWENTSEYLKVAHPDRSKISAERWVRRSLESKYQGI